ncbi:unnamed protein product, partial [Prorocentrum cordatum]
VLSAGCIHPWTHQVTGDAPRLCCGLAAVWDVASCRFGPENTDQTGSPSARAFGGDPVDLHAKFMLFQDSFHDNEGVETLFTYLTVLIGERLDDKVEAQNAALFDVDIRSQDSVTYLIMRRDQQVSKAATRGLIPPDSVTARMDGECASLSTQDKKMFETGLHMRDGDDPGSEQMGVFDVSVSEEEAFALFATIEQQDLSEEEVMQLFVAPAAVAGAPDLKRVVGAFSSRGARCSIMPMGVAQMQQFMGAERARVLELENREAQSDEVQNANLAALVAVLRGSIARVSPGGGVGAPRLRNSMSTRAKISRSGTRMLLSVGLGLEAPRQCDVGIVLAWLGGLNVAAVAVESPRFSARGLRGPNVAIDAIESPRFPGAWAPRAVGRVAIPDIATAEALCLISVAAKMYEHRVLKGSNCAGTNMGDAMDDLEMRVDNLKDELGLRVPKSDFKNDLEKILGTKSQGALGGVITFRAKATDNGFLKSVRGQKVTWDWRKDVVHSQRAVDQTSVDQTNVAGDHTSVDQTNIAADFDLALFHNNSVLSNVATAGLNHVLTEIPARDLQEYQLFPEEDLDFIRGWIA